MARLVKPSTKYKKSFLADYLSNNEMQDVYEHTGIPKTEVPKRFSEFVSKLNAQAKGLGLPKGFVSQSVYWLVDGNKFIGRTSIRHKLTPHLRILGGHIGYYIRPGERRKGYGKTILKLALKKANALGIKNVFVTCDLVNTGSKKIIEANGGKLVAKFKQAKNLPTRLRYTIKLK